MSLRLSVASASLVRRLPRILAVRAGSTVPTTPAPLTNKKSEVINQRDDMLEQIDIEDLPRAQKRFAKQFEAVNEERIKEIFARNYKNHISITVLLLLVVGIYWYTIHAVKQETFLEEIDEEVAVERAQKAEAAQKK